MRVATMALMDGVYYASAALALGLALLAGLFSPLSYVAGVLLMLMLGVLFLSIPLKLNWSSNLYGHLFRRFLFFLAFTLVVFAISYYMVGFERADGSAPSFLDALYFSTTTFTTVQYGEFRPHPASRPLVCLESVLGIIAFVPMFAAFGWLYCQNRLWKQSVEDTTIPTGLSLEHDPSVGGWREVESERTREEAECRRERLRCVPCARCGCADPRIEKLYDIIGLTTPLPLYVVHCSCGQISKPSTVAFIAAWRWKLQNEKK